MQLSSATALLALAAALAACGDTATLPVEAGMGPRPQLPPPRKDLIPTVHVAPAKGWTTGDKPVAAAGLVVRAYATGLDHPRWLAVLPNGDVLVAETNEPPKPEDAKGLRGWIMLQMMQRAGAGTPTADRITLLRGVGPDGSATTRSIFLEHLHSPFGMALVGSDLYVANSDAIVHFAYVAGATRIDAAPTTVIALPAGPINHHWTKNIIASADGSKLYATVGSNSNVGENGIAAEEGRAAIWRSTRRAAPVAFSRPACATRTAWRGAVDGTLWTVVNERDEIGSDLVPDYLDVGARGRVLWLAVQLLRPARRRARAAAAARPGREGGGARLRARAAHGVARSGLGDGRRVAGAVRPGDVHRPARLVEPSSRTAATR